MRRCALGPSLWSAALIWRLRDVSPSLPGDPLFLARADLFFPCITNGLFSFVAVEVSVR